MSERTRREDETQYEIDMLEVGTCPRCGENRMLIRSGDGETVTCAKCGLEYPTNVIEEPTR